MRICGFLFVATFLLGGFSPGVYASNDTSTRAMGLAQSYTALARGPEAAFWNPANLALGGGVKFSWDAFSLGLTFIVENNSFSRQTYNDYFTTNSDFISTDDKAALLSDIDDNGLRFNVDAVPHTALSLPAWVLGKKPIKTQLEKFMPGVGTYLDKVPTAVFILPTNKGVAFKMPWDIHSAVTLGVQFGNEGAVPKDLFDFMLYGNEFNRVYNIADWDGSGWFLGSLNWSGAKAWMPPQFKPYLSEFTVGATLKLMGGAYGEVLESDGSLVSYFNDPVGGTGTDINPELIAQHGLGFGFGLDLGVAGVTRDRKTTFSVGLLNLLDTMSWGIASRQERYFVRSSGLLAKSFTEVEDDFWEVLDNPRDENGEVIFNETISENSFSRSLPAMLRVGAAHQLMPELTLVGNWDQAFSEGFGRRTTPRISGGAEYRPTPWLPLRLGVSVGGRASSSNIGFGFGPFNFPHVELRFLNFGVGTRGGLLPMGLKGFYLSGTVLEVKMN